MVEVVWLVIGVAAITNLLITFSPSRRRHITQHFSLDTSNAYTISCSCICNVHCHVSRSSSVSRELLTISLYLSSRRRHTKLQMLHIFKLHRRRCLHSISFFLSISLFLYMLLKLMPYSRNWCCYCCYYYYWRIVLCVYQISQRELNWMFHVHIT